MATVLLTEDDQELLEMYSIWLGRLEGVSLRTATNGNEATDQLDESVDVVLLDRRMPGMTGDEVARSIRTSPVDCEVVMVSAFEPDENIDEPDYDRYLTKPVGRETLVGAVNQALGGQVMVDQ